MKFNIEGYENMTPEEKLKALENYEPDMSGYVKKDVFDKTASEAASYKKALREKQTEEEAKAQREAEEKEELLAKLKELERKEEVNNLTAEYLGLGFDKDLADKTAIAHADGDFKKVFQSIKTYQESVVKKLKADMLKSTPEPTPGGNGDEKITREAFRKMDAAERLKFAQEHPEEYKEIYGGNK